MTVAQINTILSEVGGETDAWISLDNISAIIVTGDSVVYPAENSLVYFDTVHSLLITKQIITGVGYSWAYIYYNLKDVLGMYRTSLRHVKEPYKYGRSL